MAVSIVLFIAIEWMFSRDVVFAEKTFGANRAKRNLPVLSVCFLIKRNRFVLFAGKNLQEVKQNIVQGIVIKSKPGKNLLFVNIVATSMFQRITTRYIVQDHVNMPTMKE
jgi:hypothetical protein